MITEVNLETFHIDALNRLYPNPISKVVKVYGCPYEGDSRIWCVLIEVQTKFGIPKVEQGRFSFDSISVTAIFGKPKDIRDLIMLEVAKQLPELNLQIFTNCPVMGQA